MIVTHNLTLRYSSTSPLVLNNISLCLPPGRITLFLGESGAGKSSLLRCIAGLEQPTSGTITVNGSVLKKKRPRERAAQVGIVFQQFNLFFHMTVLQNCMQPLMVTRKMFEDEARTRALFYLQQVGMEAFADRFAAQLSGGQQQRVAIARALCLEPQAILLDEASSALDPANAKILQDLLINCATRGLAIGISSHDMKFVNGILDRAYLIDKGAIADFYDKQQNESDAHSKIHQFLAGTM